jgi:hypothetical protein
MATAGQAQEIIDSLNERVAQLKEAVEEFTRASGRQPEIATVTASPSRQKAPDQEDSDH